MAGPLIRLVWPLPDEASDEQQNGQHAVDHCVGRGGKLGFPHGQDGHLQEAQQRDDDSQLDAMELPAAMAVIDQLHACSP